MVQEIGLTILILAYIIIYYFVIGIITSAYIILISIIMEKYDKLEILYLLIGGIILWPLFWKMYIKKLILKC